MAQKVLVYALDQILKLLHPFMPFLTEAIWQAIPHEGESIMISSWPTFDARFQFPAEEQEMEMVIAAIRAVRNRRAEMNVPPSKKSALYIVTDRPEPFRGGEKYLMRLAFTDNLVVSTDLPEGHDRMVSAITGEAKLFMPMEQLVDIQQELARIEKEKTKAEKNLAGIEGKLKNPGFLANAPEAVVAGEQEKAEKLRRLIAQLTESAARLQP